MMEEISLKLFTSAFMNFQFSNSFGGNFDKKEMCLALIESNYKSNYVDFLIENKDEIFKTKTIPKPFDDVTDAILYVVLLKNNI